MTDTSTLPAPTLAPDTLCIVFDGPPDRDAGRFVEVETPDGKSRSVGDWRQRADGLWSLDIPHALPMPLERARELCSIVNSYAYATLGVKAATPLPKDVSLFDLVQAREIVERENKRLETAPADGGSRSFYMLPDPRLIAAVYAIEHYPVGPQAIILRPATKEEAFWNETNFVALAVVGAVDDTDDADGDET